MMKSQLKYYVVTTVVAISTFFAVVGFSRLQGEVLGGHVSRMSVIMLFGGCVVGLVASVGRYYFRGRADSVDKTKISVDTLAELGRKKDKRRS